MDNIFIERLWRSLKYECVYLNAFETGSEARQGIGHWINRCNSERPHSAHNEATPEEVDTGLDNCLPATRTTESTLEMPPSGPPLWPSVTTQGSRDQ